jgi:HK97 family phage portal protein
MMASVIATEAGLTAIEPPMGPLRPGAGQAAGQAGWGSTYWWLGLMADYGAIFRSQPQVRKVVSFLARNMAQLGLLCYRRLSVDDRERLPEDHPLQQAIAYPQGRDSSAKLTASRLISYTVHDKAIFDNAFWLKATNGQGSMRLFPIPPNRVQPTGSDWLDPDGYWLYGRTGRQFYDPGDIVHFRGYNPDDRRAGLSPIETLRTMIMEDLASDEYREQLWRRGARMSGYLTRPSTAPVWSEGARQRFVDDWMAQYSSDGPRAGGTPILEDGMTFTAGTFSAQQTQWLEGKKFTLEQVTSAYHVPLTMVGILDHATFSNVSEQHKQLYQDTLGPLCVEIEQDVDLQLATDLDPDPTIYCEFNLAEKLKGSFEEQAAAMQTMVGAPVMTRNEARARLNLPRIEDPAADELIMPLNETVTGSAAPLEPIEGMGLTDIAAVVNAFMPRQAQAIASRPDHRFDQGRWERELASDLERIGMAGPAAATLSSAVNTDTAATLAAVGPAGLTRSGRVDAIIARFVPKGELT